MTPDPLIARLREILSHDVSWNPPMGKRSLEAELRALLADVAIEYGERFYPEWTDERHRQMTIDIRARFGVPEKP